MIVFIIWVFLVKLIIMIDTSGWLISLYSTQGVLTLQDARLRRETLGSAILWIFTQSYAWGTIDDVLLWNSRCYLRLSHRPPPISTKHYHRLSFQIKQTLPGSVGLHVLSLTEAGLHLAIGRMGVTLLNLSLSRGTSLLFDVQPNMWIKLMMHSSVSSQFYTLLNDEKVLFSR